MVVALIGSAAIVALDVSGGFNSSSQKTSTHTGSSSSSNQATYSTATVSGKILGQVFTEGNAVGNITALYFGRANGQSQGDGVPADLNSNGTYSVKLPNGMNYSVLMTVDDPNNVTDTGVCYGQTVVLNDLNEPFYVIDITPFDCG